MTVLNWIELGRMFNAVASAANLILILLTIRDWRWRSPGNRFHWSGLALLMAAIGYGNIEALSQGAQGGLRTALISVALVYITAGLVSKKRGNWREDRIPVKPDLERR